MTNVQDVLDQVNTAWGDLWPALQAHQDAFAADHEGRYWQGLDTHDFMPTNGVTSLPTIGETTPSDQPVPWPASILATALPMGMRCGCYDGPDGCGYGIRLWVQIDDDLWTTVIQVGPETQRATEWAIAPPADP